MLYKSKSKLVLYTKKSFIIYLLKGKNAIIMLRNKEFKANIYSFKDLTKLKNKLKYFKSKRNIKANTS